MKNNENTENKDLENLPPGVQISWGIEKQPQRGPKRELSINQIVETAIEIADREGLIAVSMSRVASELGFTTMSLYRYIPSKDDLLLLMQDTVCDIPSPKEDGKIDWRERLRMYIRYNMELMQNHPWFSDIPISGIPIAPNQLKFVDMALWSMQTLPLNDYEKMSIVLLLSGYARWCGKVMIDMNRAIQSGKSPGTFSGVDYSSVLKKLITPDRYPSLYPVLMSGVYTEESREESTVGDDFDFGLERIMDGIEHYIISKKHK